MRHLTAFLLALTVATPLAVAIRPDVDALLDREGLQPIQLKNIDVAHARPGASLAAYGRATSSRRRPWNSASSGIRSAPAAA